MKTLFINVISKVTLLSAMVLTSVASAQGQSLANGVKVNIPFDFTVSEKKLPAGEYSIGSTARRSDDIVLSIINLDGRSKAIRLSNAVVTTRPRDRARVVFHRYGNEYFLFQVWAAGATVGRQFPESKRERIVRTSSQTVGANVKSETVTLSVELQ